MTFCTPPSGVPSFNKPQIPAITSHCDEQFSYCVPDHTLCSPKAGIYCFILVASPPSWGPDREQVLCVEFCPVSELLSPPIPFLRDPLLTGPPSSLPPLPTKCQIHPCPPPPRPAPRNLDLKSCRVGGAGLGAATHLPPPATPPHARGLGSRRLLADSILGPWLGGCCNCCSGFPFTCSLCFFAS